jgi:starch phosphorylase
VSLAAIGQTGEDYQFESEYTVRYTGRLGFSMRVSPNHFENPITRPCNSPLKWVAE